MITAQQGKANCLSRWLWTMIGLTVLCYLANTLLGALNQDEGWYLYAARQMMGGEIPHRDFFFTQGLLMPAVYAGFGWLWSAAGIWGGRLFTAGLSVAALCIADRTLNRSLSKAEDNPLARLMFWAFTGVNLWYTYFTAIPKTYGLCTFGIALGLYLLTHRSASEVRLNSACVAIAGVVFAALVDVRVSMGILLPTIGAWLFFYRRNVGSWAWMYFLLSAGVTLLALFLPEVLLWGEQFFEAQRFHAARESMGLVGMIGCVARLMRFNPLLCLMSILIGWLWITGSLTTKSHSEGLPSFSQLWLLCAGTLAGIHLLAPVPYDDYLIPAILPFAMAIALRCADLPFDTLKPAFVKGAALATVALTLCASPVAQDWVIAGQDRFWVKQKEKPDLFLLWEVADRLRQAAQRLQTDLIWTQDTYLAVEAGLRVPKGLEMGPFSKPQAIDASAKLAAWSGYTFALKYPVLTPDPEQEAKLNALKAVYHHTLFTVPMFGQGGTSLVVAERIMP